MKEILGLVTFFYFETVTIGLVLIEFSAKTTDDDEIKFSAPTKSCKCKFSPQFYVFAILAVTMCCFYGYWMIITSRVLLGYVIIAITLYPVINGLCPSENYSTWVGRLYALAFFVFGVVVFVMRIGKLTVISDLSVAFFGIYVISFGQYLKAQISNRKKRETRMCQFTETILPMLSYDVQSKQMQSESSEPVFFFATMFVVIVWSLITCILSRGSTRWMPLMVIAVALGNIFRYVVDRNYKAVSIDG